MMQPGMGDVYVAANELFDAMYETIRLAANDEQDEGRIEGVKHEFVTAIWSVVEAVEKRQDGRRRPRGRSSDAER